MRPTGFTPRLRPWEFRTFVVAARLRRARSQRDSDIHVIIADLHADVRMVIELPSVPTGQRTRAVAAARRRFEKKFGVPPFRPHWLHLNDVRAHIYGVCFFDAPHAGGAPPNGVELHPVLRINYLGRGTRRLADPCRPPALRLAEPGRDWEDEARIEEPLVSEP